MEPRQPLPVGETSLKAALLKHGGFGGLVYYGLKLETLTPEERTEYFELKEKKSELKGLIEAGGYTMFVKWGIHRGSRLSVPVEDLKSQYEQVQERIKELEQIMDEGVGITKEEFGEILYL